MYFLTRQDSSIRYHLIYPYIYLLIFFLFAAKIIFYIEYNSFSEAPDSWAFNHFVTELINDNFNDKALAIELIPTFTAAVQGKVIFLEDLFVVRQIHEKRILLPNIFDAFLGNFWKDSCLFSINYITSLIKKFDKLQNENLHDEIKFLFSFYFPPYASVHPAGPFCHISITNPNAQGSLV